MLVLFQCELPFPETGIVYNYRLDDAGISSSENDENLEEETEIQKVNRMWKFCRDNKNCPIKTSDTTERISLRQKCGLYSVLLQIVLMLSLFGVLGPVEELVTWSARL